MMKTELQIQGRRYHLFRYPPKSQHVSLQAWDAADEYIVNYLNEHEPQGDKILLLNDDFGALGVMLSDRVNQWYSDSKVAALALEHNWHSNFESAMPFSVVKALQDITSDSKLAILKLPKNSPLLIEELIALRETMPEGALVVTAGKTNQIQKATLDLFEKHLGPTHTSLAVKKSRLIFTKVNKSLQTRSQYPVCWSAATSGLRICNLCNVFSAKQLDIGARAFLPHLPHCSNKTVLDLGCGNGVLSAHVMLQEPEKMICVDESWMAIQSAQATLQENFPNSKVQVEYCHSNCLDQVNAANVDMVLCNPPFHQQNTITDHIAWQMFNDAKRILRPGGELRIVGNRHLSYHDKLKRIFGGYKRVASNNKFVILSTIKR